MGGGGGGGGKKWQTFLRHPLWMAPYCNTSLLQHLFTATPPYCNTPLLYCKTPHCKTPLLQHPFTATRLTATLLTEKPPFITPPYCNISLGVIHKGQPHEGEGGGGWQMRTPVLILPVKGQILRTCGRGGGGCKNWQNFADVLYGWPLTAKPPYCNTSLLQHLLTATPLYCTATPLTGTPA